MARKRKGRTGESALVTRDGALALTYVNTGSRRSRRLRGYADLLAWAAEHGGLAADVAGRLGRLADERPRDAAAGFAAAEELHALLARMMNARAKGEAAPDDAVRQLNAFRDRIVPRRILVTVGKRLSWRLREDPDRAVYHPLWPIVASAIDVLTSTDSDRVKRCDAEGCDVIFLAKGRGLPRRWCDNQTCGSPFRSKRYYRRVTKPERRAMAAASTRRGRVRADAEAETVEESRVGAHSPDINTDES